MTASRARRGATELTAAPVAATDQRSAVLTRAVLRAAQFLGLKQKQLAAALGVSEASLSRLEGRRAIEPQSKEGELALLFVRAYRSLDSVFGGNEQSCRDWFHARNHHLGGTPAELVQTVTGMVHVVEYLDAMRGNI